MSDIPPPYSPEVESRIAEMVALGCQRDDLYVRANGEVYHDPMSDAVAYLCAGHHASLDCYMNSHPHRFPSGPEPAWEAPGEPWWVRLNWAILAYLARLSTARRDISVSARKAASESSGLYTG